jgi:hypothetical protein
MRRKAKASGRLCLLGVCLVCVISGYVFALVVVKQGDCVQSVAEDQPDEVQGYQPTVKYAVTQCGMCFTICRTVPRITINYIDARVGLGASVSITKQSSLFSPRGPYVPNL